MSKVESHSSGLITAITSTVVALRRQSRLLYHRLSRWRPVEVSSDSPGRSCSRTYLASSSGFGSPAFSEYRLVDDWGGERRVSEIEKEFERPEGACTVRLRIVHEW